MYDCSRVVVPQHEDDVALFDWENFPPSKFQGAKSSFTIIDECTGIDGKLIARNAFIHGQVQGLVFAEHVTVEKTGLVTGVIFCRTLTIFGKVQANIVCDSILVRDGGKLSSFLKYRALRIEQGGQVAGKFERRCVIDQQGRPQNQTEAPSLDFLRSTQRNSAPPGR
ncbi:MAG: hypothetical protein JWP16_1222 [Alphaproteobacteria bacterium]|nr:hypothetical protein [Alphaproteobacteria bacterium]MDB5740182.1 hypothetical protein [Alphaproteobacteria bacterium]